MGAWLSNISLKYKFWAVNAVAFITTLLLVLYAVQLEQQAPGRIQAVEKGGQGQSLIVASGQGRFFARGCGDTTSTCRGGGAGGGGVTGSEEPPPPHALSSGTTNAARMPTRWNGILETTPDMKRFLMKRLGAPPLRHL